jgi:prefoldin subunit 5
MVMSLDEIDPPLDQLRAQIAFMAEEIAGLRLEITRRDRYIAELRTTIDALMQPAPSELLSENLTHPSRVRRFTE